MEIVHKEYKKYQIGHRVGIDGEIVIYKYIDLEGNLINPMKEFLALGKVKAEVIEVAMGFVDFNHAMDYIDTVIIPGVTPPTIKVV